MTIADLARNAAISLEAKKDALAQRQNGDWKVSFTVQGIDMDPRLTQAAMGTRYAVVLVEIGDDEAPVQKESRPVPRQETQPQPDGAKRRDWNNVQPAAQSGIRCAEPTFRAFLRETRGLAVGDKLQAEIAIRDICGVISRVEFSTNPAKARLWRDIDTQYQAWQAKERVGA